MATMVTAAPNATDVVRALLISFLNKIVLLLVLLNVLTVGEEGVALIGALAADAVTLTFLFIHKDQPPVGAGEPLAGDNA